MSLDQIRAFLEASEEVPFDGAKREEIYGWVSETLQIHSYGRRNRAERGLLRSAAVTWVLSSSSTSAMILKLPCLQITKRCISDLDEIWDFIAEDSITAANKVNDEILDAIDALVPFPHQGHRRTDFTSRPPRFWRVCDYLIAYAPDDEPLWVVAVMHGQRSPRVMASILRSREDKP